MRREEEKVSTFCHCRLSSLVHRVRGQLREIELKVQREITEKRKELLAKEESLRSAHVIPHSFDSSSELCEHRNLESRLAAQGSQGNF